ncbi:F-box domain-containing protein [Favolaschia claudopus]|uniref:F-box domain-containing protein n=1 Tax=Favolaschia claudopus TaxID=2862362 RepID=A0AAV9ZCA0_9AGAR
MLDFLQADRALLADTDAQILDLETQIAALEHSVSLLRAARQPVQERLDSYKYPVLTLPNEIIAEIFLHFLPTYPEPPPLVGIYSPTCLAQVCHKWREIAHRTPPLWRAIDLTRPFEKPGVEEAMSLCLLWTERSGACPLSLRLSDSLEPLSTYTDVIYRCARCEHLALELDTTQDLDVIQDSFPSLKTLDMYISGLSSFPANPVVTLQNLPLLRTVVLDDWQDLHVGLPWSQLTSLTLLSLRSEICVPILQQASHLLHCELEFGNHSMTAHDLDLELPRLETLTFRPRGWTDQNFVRCLMAPRLLRLQLPEHFLLLGNSESLVIEPLVSFVSKSGCQLQELNITNPCVPDSENVYRGAFPLIPAILVAR